MQKKVGKWSGRKVGVILDRVAREELTRKIYNYKPRESLSQVMQTSEGRLWYTAGTASQRSEWENTKTICEWSRISNFKKKC
jgi:hypothetical protein